MSCTFGLAARHGLGKAEQQRQVGVDALALQLRGGLNALPRGGNLDQHAVDVHALGLVQLDDALRPHHGGSSVETQPGIDLGRHAAGDVRQDLAAKPTSSRSITSPRSRSPKRASVCASSGA
jgi:hypothetical protein